MSTQALYQSEINPCNIYGSKKCTETFPFDFFVQLGSASIFRAHIDGHSFPLEYFSDLVETDAGLVILMPLAGSLKFGKNENAFWVNQGDIVVLPTIAAEGTVFSGRTLAYGVLVPQLEGVDISTPKTLQGDKIVVEMLWQQITTVAQRSDQIETISADHLGQALLSLVAALLCNQGVDDDQSVARFKQYVEDRLFDDGLAPEQVARGLGMSRASLYRVAAPLGGVSNFIHDRRLEHAHMQLRSQGSAGGSISNLAMELGFGSEATFRRQFKKKFGISPREAIG